MGTKNNPGEFDCYANAEPDEPMFVLLGRDEKAPAIVRAWVELRRRQRGWVAATGQQASNYLAPPDDKDCEALACADAMEAWLSERNER